MGLRRDTLSVPAVLAALAVALAYAAWKLIARLSPDPEFDAREIYLPFARKLLDDPAAFLGSEQSAWVAPFTYIYPALFGADPLREKIAGIVLFLVLILLVYRIGSLLHSRPAGVAAAILLAASPTLKIFMPTALSEPPFIFLTGVWIWALCEGQRTGRTGWWVIAGLALGLATLTRSTYQLFIPLAIVAGFVLRRSGRDALTVRAGRGILIAHGVALGVLLLVVARNAALFGFPSISSGAGAGLFLGSNPMTSGYDAGYLGLALDDGAVHGGTGHLTLANDRLMRGVAVAALGDQPLGTLACMYAEKLGAFLFVTSAEWQGLPEALRGWRVALILAALYGWWHIRVPALRALLGAAFAYQLLVHLPVLYTFRYSVSAIDLPLTISAGVGIGAVFGERGRALGLGAIAALGALAGALSIRYLDPPSPHVDRVHHADFWERTFTPPLTATKDTPLEIPVKDAPGLHPWDNSILVVGVSSAGEGDARCRSFAVGYRRDGQAEFKGAVSRRIGAGSEPTTYEIGTRVPLDLYAEGVLRITADCDAGATLRVHSARLATGRFASHYKSVYLASPDLPGTLPPRH